MILLVVDVQKLITNDQLYNFSSFINNVKKLIQVARENNIEVIYVRHDDGIGTALTKGEEGFEIYDQIKPQSDEKVFDKTVNSPFKDTGLLEYLNNRLVKEIIITGLQTEYCIDASVKCAIEHGFNVIVPANGNTTIDNDYMSGETSYKYYNQFIWKKRYARCLSMDKTLEIMKGMIK